MRDPLSGYRHICPVCGKDFRVYAEWKYRRRSPEGRSRAKIYYCSWKCFRDAEKEAENGRDVSVFEGTPSGHV